MCDPFWLKKSKPHAALPGFFFSGLRTGRFFRPCETSRSVAANVWHVYRPTVDESLVDIALTTMSKFGALPCDDHASFLSDPDGSLIPDGFTLGGLLSEVSDPLIPWPVPVENSPVRGTDGFCDNAANDAIRILPAEITISGAEVVLLRELRKAFSGEIISMEWDERFASLDVETFVTDGIRSKGYLEFGLNSLL